MDLSTRDIQRLAALGRMLAKAPAIEATAGHVFQTLQSLQRLEQLRIVFPDASGGWSECVAGADFLSTTYHKAMPAPSGHGMQEYFDQGNAKAGFIWIAPNSADAGPILQLIAPQVWTGLTLHAAMGRAKRSPVSENVIIRETLRARDEERRGIARELHDDLGQSMATLKLKLKWAEDRIAARDRIDEAGTELKSARQDVGEMMGKIRDLSHTLYPRALDTLGLTAAVRELAHHATRNSGVAVDCWVEGDEYPLSREIGMAIYRCCQEAISNALKHSGARRITIAMNFGRDGVRLTVKDDGEGFDARTIGGPHSGIRTAAFWTIRQRMSDLGGSFRLSVAAGDGVALEMTVPNKSRKVDARRKNNAPDRG